MNARFHFPLVLIWLFCLMASDARAQGYGGLGTEADGFDIPSRQTAIQFPQDHGAHPGFRIEWWYLTANLKGEDGRDYGTQWTLFRSALKPPGAETKHLPNNWSTPQLWMGHAAITTPTEHFVAETRSRGVMDLAGAKAQPFKAWINDWQMLSTSSSGIADLNLTASGHNFSYQLKLSADGPLIFHGENGYSVKSSSGHASYYYSQPHYQVTGVLNLPDGPMNVSGTAWLDREWSSQPLTEDQSGWDWVSLNFEDGSKLMAAQMRSRGASKPYTSATFISPQGETTAYPDGKLKMTELKRSDVAGRSVPTGWRIELKEREIDLQIEALNSQAWMPTSFPYWEGPVIVRGSHGGRGYLEMTGYERTD